MAKLLKKHPMLPLIIPALLLMYFVYVGLGWNVWVSVSDWSPGSLEASYGFGGFQWYLKLLRDGNFWLSLQNTLLLFSIIPICLGLGLGLALLMDQGLRGTAMFRNLILLPFALSYVVTGTVWAWMYNPSNGIINSIARLMRLDNWTGTWHTSQATVMPSIILALVWQFSGYVALIFLAGIKSVPQNVINAAKLDGAYSPRIYLKLVLPQLKGALSSSITVIAMFALRSFDFIWQLTGGGPGYASHTLPVLMYRETFEKNNFAYGAAISSVLLVLVLVLILPFTYKGSKRR